MQVSETARAPLLSMDEVSNLTTLSETTLWRRIKAGEFPKPITLVTDRKGRPRRVAWPPASVYQWLDERVAQAA